MHVSCVSQVCLSSCPRSYCLAPAIRSRFLLPPAPPPPPPAKPTATLTVSPTNVQRGQSVQLAWSTQNATDVSIDPLGAVALTGNSKPYAFGFDDLHADGERSGRYCPGDRPGDRYGAPAATGGRTARASDQELFQRNVKDIYFNYDRYDVRPSRRRRPQGGCGFPGRSPELQSL